MSNLRKSSLRNLRKKNNFFSFFENRSVTYWFIFFNIVFFILYSLFYVFLGEEIIYYLGLQPNLFFSGYVWTIFTSMFMHGSLSHLFVNMVSLFFLGSFIEKLIGRKKYLWFYILAGIFAGLLFVFLAFFFGNSPWGMKIFGSPEVFAVGASGAIFGLGGLLALLTPNMRVYVFFVIPMKMWHAMIALLGVLWFFSITGGLPFGNTAHLGGLLAGVGYGLYLKKKYRKKTKMLSNYFSG